ncbi:MAG: NAD-dependent epimerase/dehydratase family protein [Acidimicrobiaceae bacterium]|nr:NAD-dependent epimerase/dehydratase family protein [Acidimicrobiaceae bacterium]
MIRRVAVTGAAGSVGTRVVALLSDLSDCDVLAIDRIELDAPPTVETKRLDLMSADLGSVFAGVDAVVHLATTVTPGEIDAASEALEMAILHRVLDAAMETDVTQMVSLSTAMVYGAWVGNPVPITEDAATRPNPDFGWAVLRGEIEKATLEWANDRDVVAAVLRPTAVVAQDHLGQLARVLHTARIGIAAEGDPPVQYLHVDDLAAAIVTAVEREFDGVVNVAPDGWIPPDALHDLEGPQARVRVPAVAARWIAAIRWRAGLSPIPPGIVPYTSHSWVVANDRMRGLGWEPRWTNEEAWVVSHHPGPLDRLPARKQQELALAAAGVTAALTLGGLGFLVRRIRRKTSDAVLDS